MSQGRTSLGDKLFLTASIVRDGTVKGTAELEVTARGAGSVRKGQGSGVVSAVYHFSDGDLYLAGIDTFDESATDHGVVAGGTGAYAGARGTIDSANGKDVVHLIP